MQDASASRGLAAMLELEQLEALRFRAPEGQPNQMGMLFGGSVLGQATRAVALSRPDRKVHGLHGYFLRAGSPKEPVDYAVEILRDGGSFSTCRVTATQGGQAIFAGDVSLQVEVSGPQHEHAQPWRKAPADPETLADFAELGTRWAGDLPPGVGAKLVGLRNLEVRPLHPEDMLRRKSPPGCVFWIRVKGPSLPAELHGAAMAFASDYILSAGPIMPYRNSLFSPDLMAISLDHAMWFHEHVDPTQWLLHEIASPWAGKGRGLSHGRLYTRDGRLVASTAQEMLLQDRR